MSSPRLSENWLKDDEDEKKDILKRLHSMLSDPSKNDLGSLEGMIDFLASCSYGRESKESVHSIFKNAAMKKISFDEFEKHFEFLSSLEAKLLVFNSKKLGQISSWQGKNTLLTKIDGSDLDKLRQYLHDGDISASLSIGNAESKNFESFPKDSAPYAIHSVAKIFTGVLLLIMIGEKIVTEEMLEKPIYDGIINDNDLAILPEKIQTHLKEKNITLLQLMTHHGGIGDYGYDEGTGDLRAMMKEGLQIKDLNDIKNFLYYAEKEVFDEKSRHYSNLGLTMVGLAIEHAYRKLYPDHPLLFNEILNQYIIKEAKMKIFSAKRPDDGKYNKDDPVSKDWVGGPAGGYWTTTEDLSKFGMWLFDKCKKNNNFKSLIEKYGKGEYYIEGRGVEHPGNSPSSSAFLSISLSTGNIVSILSDKPGIAIALGLELVMGHKIFKQAKEEQEQLSTTAMISTVTGAPPSPFVVQPDKELSQSSPAATKSSDHLIDPKSDEETQKAPSSSPNPRSTPK